MNTPGLHSVETLRYLRGVHLKQARRCKQLGFGNAEAVPVCIEYAREFHRELMAAKRVQS